MPTLSKLRLSILLLFLQLFVYLYVVPKGTHLESSEGGYPLEEDCKTSYPTQRSCFGGEQYFKELAGNCGVRREEPPEAVIEEEPPPIEDTQTEEYVEETAQGEEESEHLVMQESHTQATTATHITNNNQTSGKQHLTEDSKDDEEDKTEEPVHEKSGPLIYQIIIVMLFLSVSFALADCFQERAKKKANPENERHDGLSRRMSLADLTMSRHARKESQQASYRPIGKPRGKTSSFGNS